MSQETRFLLVVAMMHVQRRICAIAMQLAASCRSEPDSPPPAPPLVPAPAVRLSDTAAAPPAACSGTASPSATGFDCSGFLPASGAGCAVQPEVPPAAAALLRAAGKLLAYQAMHHPPDDRWAALRDAVDGAAVLPVGKLATEARIVLQNAALRIAVSRSSPKARPAR